MKLSQTQKIQLEDLRSSTSDKKLFVKVSVVIMLSEGYEMSVISKALGVSISSIKRYKKSYKDRGIDGLEICLYEGRPSFLTEEDVCELELELDKHIYISSQEIQAYIEQTYGLRYSLSGVRALLKRMGYVYKKAKLVPGKADRVEQERQAKALTELYEHLEEDEALYFIDGTHPTHNTQACRGWIKKGQVYPLPSNTGRQRLNINGAIDIMDKTRVYVDYTDSVNAQSTLRLLTSIIENNSSKQKIYIVSDNARYYRSRVLKDWLNKHPKIEWIYLPAYSPNLNLIERLWGLMQKKIINGYYYETYTEFKKSIEGFFENISDYKEELESLLRFKFQMLPE